MTESKIVFPRVHAFATLLDAWHHIEDNDGAPGVDVVTLDDFELRVEENINALERDLRERLYLPQAFLRASNLYLDHFDEALLARGMRLVRFADDFIVLCKERPAADAALELSETVLGELQLALDPEKTRVFHFPSGQTKSSTRGE